MSIYFFNDITTQESFLGGKGFALGLMKNAGFPIPDGLILTEFPETNEEWSKIFSWWKKSGNPNLAIRSSAVGEDSEEQSFAGQNSSFLNINTEQEIKQAIKNCFQSMYRKSSTLYRQYFQKENAKAKMNVVIQIMVNPKYSGVFFSVDPRSNEKKWILEAIEGLGEDLVSGKKTPWHFEENKKHTANLFNIDEVAKLGLKIRDFFNYEIDIEWAIDQENNLKILQARPITALNGKSEEKRMIALELKRLTSTHAKDSLWDGGTFAEWSGPPTELTFSIWSEAFAKNHAFSKALKKLGYLGIDKELTNETHSLLEKIFDRAYVNLSMLAPLYFGEMPYKLTYDKTAKLKFDFSKMTFLGFLKTPITMARMIKVGYTLSTKRSTWLNECTKELANFQEKSFRVKDVKSYQKYCDEELLAIFKKETENFYDQHLVWPLVLIILIESTSQSLKALLKGVIAESEIDLTFNNWLGKGLHSVTMDMNNEYKEASLDTRKRESFFQKYGHRGPGELELSNPRWLELSNNTFFKMNDAQNEIKKNEQLTVEDEIKNLKTLKKQAIEKEWHLLKEMLELREKWKMNILSPYSHMRFIILEIAERKKLGDLVFWFNFKEILESRLNLAIAVKRKQHAQLSKSIYLPTIVELSKLNEILNSEVKTSSNTFTGSSLSPGLVFGEVRVVIDPDSINTNNWPENTILVAESTDPGWTGLFLKSKAVIVEKGGVLSHCAIVAREMSLPAISEIKQCHLRFKDGDKIWVDGNNGRITLVN